MIRSEQFPFEEVVRNAKTTRIDRDGLSLSNLLTAIFLCSLISAIGSDFGAATLVPALLVTFSYLLIKPGRLVSEQTKKVLFRFGGLAYCASLFLICIKVRVIVNADPASLSGLECLTMSFRLSINFGSDLAEHMADWRLAFAAKDLLALAVFAGFCCSAATVIKWITLEFDKRIKIVDSILDIAIVFATPMTWSVPLLLGQVSVGYFVWTASVFINYFAIATTNKVFCFLFLETCAVLLAIRLFGFPT